MCIQLHVNNNKGTSEEQVGHKWITGWLQVGHRLFTNGSEVGHS